ncbi:MAG: zf-HC2 domain-containing protein [Syntrophomonadaceae bacterium]|nr:zf-HC2 domain-containing protein [Syntrophomonadaceae bacterium]
MNCQQINKYILPYCDNNLPPELVRQIDEHIASCESCANNITLTRIENSVLHNLPALEPRTDFTNDVMQKVFVTTPKDYKLKSLSKKALVTLIPIAAVLLVFIATTMPNFFNLSKISSPDISQMEVKNYAPRPQTAKEPSQESLRQTVDTGQKIADSENTAINEPKEDSVKLADNNNVFMANIEANNFKEEAEKIENYSSRAAKLKTLDNNANKIEISLANIPSDYILANVYNVSNQEIAYQYIDSNNNLTLDITLTKLETDIVEESQPFSISADMASQDEITSTCNISQVNEYSLELVNDADLYLVNFISSMPLEELIKIASSVTIK